MRPAGLTPGAGAGSRGLGLEMGTRWATPGRATGLLVLLLRCFELVEPSGNRAASTLLLWAFASSRDGRDRLALCVSGADKQGGLA